MTPSSAINPAITPPDLPLRDIHLPAKIGYWPLAPGWWLLLGIIILLGLGLLLFIRFRQRRRLRRLALRQLDSLQTLRGNELATALSRLLRQAAISHFPRHQVAGLSGDAWLEFLDRPFPDRPFSSGPGKVLGVAPYRPAAEIEGSQLIPLCRSWLKKLPPRSLSFWRGR
ncbi:DUF4381 domain-containing protein [Geopsychrobacter electrodiphilus]|uniref:DUF4381 domain-containing protein n=1 Tax=Geopsychrobacter electrodiphilus TaxID=225196 RepID=UPI0003707346|nr:DUF4381 domain-containing protein [Geopsychrobacter electrodiphilus]